MLLCLFLSLLTTSIALLQWPCSACTLFWLVLLSHAYVQYNFGTSATLCAFEIVCPWSIWSSPAISLICFHTWTSVLSQLNAIMSMDMLALELSDGMTGALQSFGDRRVLMLRHFATVGMEWCDQLSSFPTNWLRYWWHRRCFSAWPQMTFIGERDVIGIRTSRRIG